MENSVLISARAKMLIILTIFAVLLATAIVVFAKRRTSYLLEENQPRILPPPTDFRPLFEPGPEELREAERKEELKLEAAKEEDARRAQERRAAELDAFRDEWRAGPTRKNTIELLYLASKSERGMIYAEIAGEIIKLWKNGQIAGLSADDLSQLVESHFWLLPARERTSGVNFSINEEIADLRRSTEENK
jgi:hypothetical protein